MTAFPAVWIRAPGVPRRGTQRRTGGHGPRSPVALGASVAAFAAWLAIAAPAAGHALLRSSDPAANAAVQAPVTLVSLTFTEAPDPQLSSVIVLDSTGASRSTGRAEATEDPATLHVPVRSLGPGVYTVSWRSVSAVDGHVAAGSFAFGVGVPAVPPATVTGAAAPSVPTESPGPSALAIAGRWLLFVGLVVLLGAAFSAVVVVRSVDPATVRALGIGLLVACLGTVALVAAEASDAGVGLGQLAGTSLGRSAIERAIPLVTAALFVGSLARPSRHRSQVLGGVAAAAAGAMLVDASLSHAAAGEWPVVNVGVQWLHVLLAGIWIGGLAALLLHLRSAPKADVAASARRFAQWATLGLVVVAATGVIRAIVEVGNVSALADTDYGHLVVAKTVMLVVVAPLGAINHFRNVPRGDLRGLRRVGSTEVAFGAALLLAAAGLVNVAPPVSVAAAVEPAGTAPSVAVTGHDYGTTVRLRLEVSPGVAGFNHFAVSVVDYDSGAPVSAERVQLRFRLPGRAEIAGSQLSLSAGSAGSFSGSGANLSLRGTWNVTALVVRGTASVEVPLQVAVAAPPQQIDVNRATGVPTLYTVHIGGGNTVQVYLDPGQPGRNDFHATFFNAQGNELPVTSVTVSAAPTGGNPQLLDLRTLEPGHVVATLDVAAVPTTFSVTATAPDGTLLAADVDITPGT